MSYNFLEDLLTQLQIKDNFWGLVFSRLIKQEVHIKSDFVFSVNLNNDGTITLKYNKKFMMEENKLILIKLLEHEGLHILHKHLIRIVYLKQLELLKNNIKIKNLSYNESLIIMFKNQLMLEAADMSINQLINFEISRKDMKWYFYDDTNKLQFLSAPLIFPEDYNLPNDKTFEWYYYTLLEQNKDTIEKIKNNEYVNEDINKLLNKFNIDIIENSDNNDNIYPETLNSKYDDYLRQLIIDASNQISNANRGLLPNYIKEYIDSLLKPSLPYYELVKKFVLGSKWGKKVSSLGNPNRKKMFYFKINNKLNISLTPFPGYKRDKTYKIGILLDTSGSQTNKDIAEGLSGIKSLIEKDKNIETRVVECDTKVHKNYLIKKISDINYEVKGRGGTQLFPGILELQKYKPDCIIVFTDGYCENFKTISHTLLHKKILWILPKTNYNDTTIEGTGIILHRSI